MKQFLQILLFLVVNNGLVAQTHFTEVYNVFQAKCITCHNAQSPSGNLDLSGTVNEVYQTLINAEIDNEAAKQAGYEMVKPGNVRESFLFRKINQGLDEGINIASGEGALMPTYGTPLENYEMELIRQWIAAGAKEMDNSFDYDLIKEYYEVGGIDNIQALAPPAEGEGFQIFLEPVFLEPGGETEFYNKIKLAIPDDLEVVGLEANINEFSHHFILYKYKDDFDAQGTIPEGRRYMASTLFENLITVFDIFANGFPVGIWQYDHLHQLPEGTAYIWDKEAVFDLNYHVKNYSQTQIMSAQVYLNVYTRPKVENSIEMEAGLIPYGEYNPLALEIPNNGQDTTFVMEMYDETATDTLYFWLLQSHTHQLGIDFDMYLRKEDGTLGEQIYEGMRDPEHENFIGYYDYAHPPVLTYEDELLAVPLNQGLTHVATYNNSTEAPVNFGFTTKDEMFITYFHFTREPLPISETITTNNVLADVATTSFDIAPNPFAEKTSLSYNLDKIASVAIRVYDVSGKLIKSHNLGKQTQGAYQFELDANWKAGVYFVQLMIDGQSQVKEVLKLK